MIDQYLAKGKKVVMFKAWQQDFCGGDTAAAMVLQFFCYHDQKLRFKQQENSSKKPISLLQRHNTEQIKKGLGYLCCDKVIRRSIKLLVEKGILATCRNPNPQYKYDNTKHYRLNLLTCYKWLYQNNYLIKRVKKSAINNTQYKKQKFLATQHIGKYAGTIEKKYLSKDRYKNNNIVSPSYSKRKYDRTAINAIGNSLSKTQINYLQKTIENLKALPNIKISSPKELFYEMEYSVLSDAQFTGNSNFRWVVNAISKLIRTGQWRKPIGFNKYHSFGQQQQSELKLLYERDKRRKFGIENDLNQKQSLREVGDPESVRNINLKDYMIQRQTQSKKETVTQKALELARKAMKLEERVNKPIQKMSERSILLALIDRCFIDIKCLIDNGADPQSIKAVFNST